MVTRSPAMVFTAESEDAFAFSVRPTPRWYNAPVALFLGLTGTLAWTLNTDPVRLGLAGPVLVFAGIALFYEVNRSVRFEGRERKLRVDRGAWMPVHAIDALVVHPDAPRSGRGVLHVRLGGEERRLASLGDHAAPVAAYLNEWVGRAKAAIPPEDARAREALPSG